MPKLRKKKFSCDKRDKFERMANEPPEAIHPRLGIRRNGGHVK